ncbi:MAG: short chain dehydrogenase, partial [Deltaproteobacteria bacterium]|nr:short chain dehydrogenase [Nannocystaceae bacterium]
MTDFLLENDAARRLIQTLGLPVPVPMRLRRADGPVQERPLHDDTVVVGQFAHGPLADVLARALTSAGAS